MAKPVLLVRPILFTLGVFSLHQSDTLQQAIQLLSEEKIHSLRVLDEQEKVMGLLNLKQAINLIAENTPINTPLSEVNLSRAFLVDIQQPLATVVKEMKHCHDYKVIVTNQKGEIEGIISGFDILKYIAQRQS